MKGITHTAHRKKTCVKGITHTAHRKSLTGESGRWLDQHSYLPESMSTWDGIHSAHISQDGGMHLCWGEETSQQARVAGSRNR